MRSGQACVGETVLTFPSTLHKQERFPQSLEFANTKGRLDILYERKRAGTLPGYPEELVREV